MRRPKLTKNVIDGLGSLHGEIEVTIDARHGWGDVYPEDANAEKALRYIEELIRWWPHRRRDQAAHAKGRSRSRRA